MVRRNNGSSASTLGRRDRARSASALARLGAGAANAVFINQHESGSFPAFLDSGSPATACPRTSRTTPKRPHAVLQANRQSYGVAWPALDFTAARLIVSFGADFLDRWGASVPQQLAFADARAKLADAPRFVYIGPRRSLTGLNADEWIACKPGSELAIVNALRRSRRRSPRRRRRAVSSRRRCSDWQPSCAPRSRTSCCRASRRERGGRRARRERAEPGGRQRRRHDQAGRGARRVRRRRHTYELRDAVQRMASGAVPLVLFRGANPGLRAAQAAAAWPRRLAEVPFKVSFSSYPDETTDLCDLILPDHHSLESWGDAEPVRGTMSPAAAGDGPACSDTRSTADVLIGVTQGDPATAARYPVADYRAWLIARYPGGAQALRTALARGVGAGTPAQSATTPRTQPPRRRRRRSRGNRATCISSSTTRRCSATGVAATSRGCRSCPIPSARLPGNRGSRSTRTTARGWPSRTAIT